MQSYLKHKTWTTDINEKKIKPGLIVGGRAVDKNYNLFDESFEVMMKLTFNLWFLDFCLACRTDASVQVLTMSIVSISHPKVDVCIRKSSKILFIGWVIADLKLRVCKNIFAVILVYLHNKMQNWLLHRKKIQFNSKCMITYLLPFIFAPNPFDSRSASQPWWRARRWFGTG